MQLTDNNIANRLVLAQLAASFFVSFLLLAFGWVPALSGLIGGGIATLANAVFAYKIFARYRAQEPGKLVARFHGAEIQKLILTGLLLGAAVVWIKPLSLGALFGAYMFIHIVPMLFAHFIKSG